MTELLKVHLRGKYQLKREDDITQMLKQRMEGYVAEEEWVSIIKYMYNHEDSVELIVKLKDVIRMRQQELIAQKVPFSPVFLCVFLCLPAPLRACRSSFTALIAT